MATRAYNPHVEVTQSVQDLITKLKISSTEKLPMFPSEISALLTNYETSIKGYEISDIVVKKRKEA
jgi:hypothetical protein